MTRLDKPVTRVSNTVLRGSFGPDNGRSLVVTLIPGAGDDFLELRPLGCQQSVTVSLSAIYSTAVRNQAMRNSR